MEMPEADPGPTTTSDPGDPQAAVAYDVSSDDERYPTSFAGLHDTAVIPLDVGLGPNHLRVISNGRIHAASHVIENPIIAHATIADRDLNISFIERLSPGSINRPITVAPNDAYFVGPGIDHSSVAMPGTQFDLTVLSIDDVRERAEDMGLHLGDIDHPSILRLSPRPALGELRMVLTDLLQLSVDLPPPRWALDELLTSATMALAEAWPERLRRARATVNSIVVVRRCRDHAMRLKRRPLMHELSRAAGVPERTVRRAFTDVFDVPPSVYFRLWALDRAHRRLVHSGSQADTVTQVAHEVGFAHLGRFARQYREVYGQLPSQTLRMAAANGPHEANAATRVGADDGPAGEDSSLG